MTARDIENRFLGSLLGLAIGDALGMPISDMPVDEAQQRFGRITDYLPRDAGDESQIPAGEITDETETTLCIVESMTTNDGHVDPENINARLLRLAEGASQHWMPPDIRAGIIAASENGGVVPEGFERPPSLAAGMMGVPIGLMHSVGAFDRDAFERDLRAVVMLTNTAREQVALTTQIATAIVNAIRGEMPRIAPSGARVQGATVTEIADKVAAAESFADVVLQAVNSYRPADSSGALAGALAGARFGASGIPQHLIDELSARIYVTLAVPWFYRTAIRRAGLVIDLRHV